MKKNNPWDEGALYDQISARIGHHEDITHTTILRDQDTITVTIALEDRYEIGGVPQLLPLCSTSTSQTYPRCGTEL